MAWYAELLRRNWYCINGNDMIWWYKKYLYESWYQSLSDEEKERLAEYEKRKREKRKKELKENLLQLNALMECFIGRSYGGISNQKKYHGLYDEAGNPDLEFFSKKKDI